MAGGIKPPKRLEVRSSTLEGVSGPSVTTERGTADPMPQARADTADTMPQASRPTESDMPWSDRGPKTLPDQHVSWKALQAQPTPMGSSPTQGMMAGAGGGDIGQEMGQPKHMPGVVPKNKAPF